MRVRHLTGFAVWLVVVLLLVVAWSHPALCAPPEGEEAGDTVPRGRLGDLRYLTAELVGGKPTVVAGDEGVLEATFTPDPGIGWAQDRGPLMVCIGPPPESGITFPSDGESPRWDGKVEVLVPIDRATGPITVGVPYEVSSRVWVKDYRLELFVSAPLVTPEGSYQDSGIFSTAVRVETPLRTKLLVLGIIFVAIFLFVVEWVRVDVVAILMMVSLPVLNLLSSKLTFTGLSSNAVMAIIGVMVVSAGLNRVGIVSQVVKPVIRLAGKSPSKLMIYLSALIASISSVMQNTGAAVLFLPGIRHACREIRTPISSILMPIGMCAILGGTMTMIGTSPLILLNDILPAGMEKFSLLELTPIGVAFVIAGIAYFSTAGRYFLRRISEDQARRLGSQQDDEATDIHTIYHDLDGPFEIAVPLDFHPGELPTEVVAIRRRFLVNIVGIADARGMYELAPVPGMKVRGGHQLCAYGPENAVREFAEYYKMKVLDRPRRFVDLFNSAVAGTVEAVVSPRSSMIGSTVHEIGFRRTFGVTLLALYREGRVYYREMSDIPLRSGDALLLHSTWERFRVFQQSHRHFRIMTALEEMEIQNPGKSTAALTCFAITMILMLVSSFYFGRKPYNPIPLSVCLMGGGLGMVLTGVMSIREAYHSIDWRTVFLLGGLIPLGMAVDGTGTAEWIASGVVTALGDVVTPLVLLSILAVMSGAFCLVMSNVGACTLLVPLGVSMASQIGIDPRVAAIVVGLGVSNSFFLPTHQVNALYMGPGDYRTRDYMKIGGLLSLLYAIILVTMTYLFYL